MPEQLVRALRPRFLGPPAPTRGAPRLLMAAATAMAVSSEEPEHATSAFTLSLAEWIDIQLGMANLERVAFTMRNIGRDLEAPAGQAEQASREWRDRVFPELRAAAADIRDYGLGVQAVVPQGLTRQQLLGRLQELRAMAEMAGRRVERIYGDVESLEGRCALLRAALDRAHRDYERKAASAAATTSRLREELGVLSTDLPRRQALYHHYVTVASTTVTYAWIPFFGWIAGASVAGVYGDKAASEKAAIDRDTQRIAEITRTLDQQNRQLAILLRATHGLDGMAASLTRVLPVLQHTRGVWYAIGGDLGDLARRVESASEAELGVLLTLTLEAEAAGWREVADRAAQYLAHVEVVAADPAPFGRFRTQVRYAGRTFDERHELVIDLLGAAVNGIPVHSPVFEGARLRWSRQADGSRHDKPEAADVVFTGNAFTGVCTFPREGPIGWIGTRI